MTDNATQIPVVHSVFPLGKSTDFTDHYATLIAFDDGSYVSGFQPVDEIDDLVDRGVTSPSCDCQVVSFKYWHDPIAVAFWRTLMAEEDEFATQQHEAYDVPLPDPSVPSVWALTGVNTDPELDAKLNAAVEKAVSTATPAIHTVDALLADIFKDR